MVLGVGLPSGPNNPYSPETLFYEIVNKKHTHKQFAVNQTANDGMVEKYCSTHDGLPVPAPLFS